MPQTTTIKSVPSAFRMMKFMQVQGNGQDTVGRLEPNSGVD